MDEPINPRWQAFCSLRLRTGEAINKFEYMIWNSEMKRLYLISIGEPITLAHAGSISDVSQHHDAFTKFIEEYVK